MWCKSMERFKLVTVKIPESLLEKVDKLVEKGVFATRSEAIRVALKELVERQQYFNKIIEETRTGKIKYIPVW